MERQLEELGINSADAWTLFLAFLEKVGVDKMKAVSAEVRVDAGIEGGIVAVVEFAKNKDGHLIIKGDRPVKKTTTYMFCR